MLRQAVEMSSANRGTPLNFRGVHNYGKVFQVPENKRSEATFKVQSRGAASLNRVLEELTLNRAGYCRSGRYSTAHLPISGVGSISLQPCDRLPVRKLCEGPEWSSPVARRVGSGSSRGVGCGPYRQRRGTVKLRIRRSRDFASDPAIQSSARQACSLYALTGWMQPYTSSLPFGAFCSFPHVADALRRPAA